MIMPMPDRSDNYIAARQGHLLALYSRKAVAIHDEAAGKGNVAMSRRRLARVDELEAGVDGVCREGRFCDVLEWPYFN
jgi:hypothetical protein